ncbi:MAG TPA: helix-turn-helix transcriptional regulator [Tepidisphaeraceae bacterium]|nr:helix-turn-helix transcriptional regulator [Tepidisphaeraceae bacterium]
MGLEDEIRKAVAADSRSRREIAEAVGIHEVSLSRFMGGERGIGLDTAERLARVLGVKIKIEKSGRPRRV